MKDINKKDADPAATFVKHLNYMTIQNSEYYNLINESKNNHVKCYIKKADARKTNLPQDFIDLIITSPPYAISYEYADIHQLSLLWFGFINDLSKVRAKYIGTSSKRTITNEKKTSSTIATKVIKSLSFYDAGLANQVNNYVMDLEKSFGEMHRVLKYGKRACILIGDTKYKGVNIKNTEVSVELLKTTGFRIEDIIKRKISSKIFTPYRDSKGKFSSSREGNKIKIYQYEYIIIARKSLKTRNRI